MTSHNHETTSPCTTILRFPSRRGRPRSNRQTHDTGTPELVMKRLKGETAEALDLCMERDIISREQHWCGIHLRWLYTLRFGAPGIRAIDPTHIGGIEIKPDDPEWRSAREAEYHDAIEKLNNSGRSILVTNICIYNERPQFLVPKKSITKKQAQEIDRTITHLREGLDTLAKQWEK
jgi:hypothetical protein